MRVLLLRLQAQALEVVLQHIEELLGDLIARRTADERHAVCRVGAAAFTKQSLNYGGVGGLGACVCVRFVQDVSSTFMVVWCV